MAGHDADLDLLRRDHAGAIRSEQERLPALHAVAGANHVADGNAFGNANHQIQVGVDGLIDGRRGKRRRHVDDADRRAGGFLRFAHRRVNRDALERFARFFRVDPGDEALLPVGIFAAHARVELTGLAGDSLRDDLGVLVDQNAHSDFLVTSFPRRASVQRPPSSPRKRKPPTSFPQKRESSVVILWHCARNAPTRRLRRTELTTLDPRLRGDDEPVNRVWPTRQIRRASATTFSAASPMLFALMIGSPDSARILRPSSSLVPFMRTTSGTLSWTSRAAATTPVAMVSHFMMPPKMLTRIAFRSGFLSMILKASVTFSAVAPPPTSRKLAGSPP